MAPYSAWKFRQMVNSEENRSWTADESFPSVSGQGRDFIDKVLAVMRDDGWEERDLFAVNIAMEESITNAIEHGNRCDLRKRFHLFCNVSANRVDISVRDEGKGFAYHQLPDPASDENLCKPTGRGIFLISRFMSQVSFNENGNEIRMVKNRVSPTAAAN